jgi:hypothetical protein
MKVSETKDLITKISQSDTALTFFFHVSEHPSYLEVQAPFVLQKATRVR